MKILPLLIFLLLMNFACVPPCPERYTKQSALSIHQAKGPHVTAPVPSLDTTLEKRRARKRQRLEAAPVDTSIPVASASSASSAPPRDGPAAFFSHFSDNDPGDVNMPDAQPDLCQQRLLLWTTRTKHLHPRFRRIYGMR
ncbi:hypothetical protein K438DRAFT_1756027 [Mycena galopus ATCC 62051]|nr:hypothetical protein K438DRAFT_1756027 [Mycena galopus ATCC 62051]